MNIKQKLLMLSIINIMVLIVMVVVFGKGFLDGKEETHRASTHFKELQGIYRVHYLMAEKINLTTTQLYWSRKIFEKQYDSLNNEIVGIVNYLQLLEQGAHIYHSDDGHDHIGDLKLSNMVIDTLVSEVSQSVASGDSVDAGIMLQEVLIPYFEDYGSKAIERYIDHEDKEFTQSVEEMESFSRLIMWFYPDGLRKTDHAFKEYELLQLLRYAINNQRSYEKESANENVSTPSNPFSQNSYSIVENFEDLQKLAREGKHVDKRFEEKILKLWNQYIHYDSIYEQRIFQKEYRYHSQLRESQEKLINEFSNLIVEQEYELTTYFEEFVNYFWYGLIISWGVIVVVFVCITVLFSSIRKSTVVFIDMMLCNIRQVQNGNLQSTIDSHSTDEFGVVTRSFSKMIEVRQENLANLQKAQVKAEEANKAKTRFLANMSHELRTPLNAIMVLSQLLVDDSDMEKEQRIECLKDIHESGESLLSIINDLLDISKIEAGKVELTHEEFNVREMIDSIQREFENCAPDKKHIKQIYEVNDTVPVSFIGDRGRVKQIIQQLVSNGIKFTEKGFIKVLLSCKINGDYGDMVISVEDSGIGMSEKQKKQAFQSFYQGDSSTTRAYGGTGLGLSICQSLVKKMNGTISIKSNEGKGTKVLVSISLPIDDIRENKKECSQKDCRPQFQKSILLVEDNKFNQKVATKLLKKFGCSVSVAENGQEGLAKAISEEFDMIFMDCQMPVMDGFEATENIRQWEQRIVRKNIIVAVTANAHDRDRQKCLDVGMDDFISKPINVKAVEGIFVKYFTE